MAGATLSLKSTFRERIDEIKIASEFGSVSSPALYIKPKAAGYEIGLSIPWQEEDVAIATLPYEEFSLYQREQSDSLWDILFLSHAVDREWELTEEIKREREKSRTEHGWKRKDLPGEEWIEHKYFGVVHRRI